VEVSPGEVESGDAECVRGEWREVRAAVVAPLDVAEALVVMVRGEEREGAAAAVLDCVDCDAETLGVGLPCCCRAEWARKAERKEKRNGWFDGISALDCCFQ
jgi:hypothetical protein